MKVSVVVPVYNPGKFLEPCIASLLAQTMPTADFEVLFVDDGSTDDTPARLDKLAASHPHIRVIHQENSGWPGKPRNVGVDAARGDYVQFVDQDDRMGPEALARLHAIGSRNDADIVIGKVVSDFRGVPHGVFQRNVERCTIHDWPLIDSLTPHKMFRKAFLVDNGIAYPEGKRRLEDQLYMVRTYLAAKSVSIVGDYACYFYMRRSDGKNAGSTPIDPPSYFENLREVLDVIVDQTEPGDFRNGLMRRFYRNELLGRLTEPAILNWKDDYRQLLFDEVRRLAVERFPDEVPDAMMAVPRIRSVLLRQDRLTDMVEFARRLKPIHAQARLTDSRWRDGVLHLQVNAAQWLTRDQPLVVEERDGSLRFDPSVVGGAVEDRWADVTTDVADAYADVVIRNRSTAVEWFVPHDLQPRLVPWPAGGPHARRLEFVGSAQLDPVTVAGGAPLSRGTWDVAVRIHALGLVNRDRLGDGVLADSQHLEPLLSGRKPVAAIPLFTEFGNLTVDIDEHVRWLAGEVGAREPLSAKAKDSKLAVPLPVRAAATGGTWPARATVADGEIAQGFSVTVPATIAGTNGRAVLRADLQPPAVRGPVQQLRGGTYDLYLHTGTRALPPVLVGKLRLPPVTAEELVVDATRRARRLRRRADFYSRKVQRPAASYAQTVRRKIPHPVRRKLLDLFGRR